MHPPAANPNGNEAVADLAHDDAPVRTPRNHRAHRRELRLPVRADVVCGSLIYINPCAEEGEDAPIVTTSGLSAPKLLRRRFIEAVGLGSACLGDSGHEGGVYTHI